MENLIKSLSSDIKIYNSPEDFQRGCTDYIVNIILECINAYGRCTIALSGGSTPRNIYKLLGSVEYLSQIRWEKVYLFWGDERCVPPFDPHNNFKMVDETLISKVPIPSQHIFRIPSEETPIEAASRYEHTLKFFFGNGIYPSFDIILLGLGEEGHIASLFPGSSAIEENQRWVVSTYVEKLKAFRITLTFPVINNAKHIIFLVSGSNKAEILKKIFAENQNKIPAKKVSPQNGKLIWLLDKDAASLLDT
jgi:6-phosphogluconolactonase